MEGLPKHQHWKGAQLVSTALQAAGARGQAFPGWEPPAPPAWRASLGGSGAGRRLCAPCARGAPPPGPTQHWELPQESPSSSQTSVTST